MLRELPSIKQLPVETGNKQEKNLKFLDEIPSFIFVTEDETELIQKSYFN